MLNGRAACNRFFGNYEMEGEKLTFSSMGATRMACPDMSLEEDIVAALEEVRSFGKLPNGNVALFTAGSMMAFELFPMR